MKNQRIWAWIGLALIGVSVVLMLAGWFAGAAKALLLNISLVCFLGAAAVLLLLGQKRRQAEEEDGSQQE